MSHGLKWGALAFGAALLLTSGVANAANKCAGGKINCANIKQKALLVCHQKAELKGTAVDPACIQKAEDKYSGGAVPSKGCFAKLEAKGGCFTVGDSATIENKVLAFVLDVVTELDPGFPAPVTNKCSAGKKKCVFTKTSSILKCYQTAQLKGLPVDPACIQKAEDKYSGGADPTKGCFAKLELKPPCLTTGDSAALEAKVLAFIHDLIGELVPFCGDGVVAPGEQCDDGNASNNDACLNNCTNNTCGDGFLNPATEQCDDGGNVSGDGCSATCQLEFCGDGITQPGLGEQCDSGGVDTATCDGGDCTLPVCGDGHVNLAAGEVCDPPGSAFAGGNGNGICDNCVSPSGAFLDPTLF